MIKVFLVFMLAMSLNATTLSLVKGEVKAHTEVFGDSSIDPMSTKVNSILIMPKGIESLKGSISFDATSLVSDNIDRDKNMYEALEVKKHSFISFQITTVQRQGDKYLLKGRLTLNGTQSDIDSLALIEKEENSLSIKGSFSIKMSDFDITPPSMLFLTVRDQVDIEYTLNYKEEKE
jgi:polyisoprenoid-binding protein YceI